MHAGRGMSQALGRRNVALLNIQRSNEWHHICSGQSSPGAVLQGAAGAAALRTAAGLPCLPDFPASIDSHGRATGTVQLLAAAYGAGVAQQLWGCRGGFFAGRQRHAKDLNVTPGLDQGLRHALLARRRHDSEGRFRPVLQSWAGGPDGRQRGLCIGGRRRRQLRNLHSASGKRAITLICVLSCAAGFQGSCVHPGLAAGLSSRRHRAVTPLVKS